MEARFEIIFTYFCFIRIKTVITCVEQKYMYIILCAGNVDAHVHGDGNYYIYS